jgi:hypothetical protein
MGSFRLGPELEIGLIGKRKVEILHPISLWHRSMP